MIPANPEAVSPKDGVFEHMTADLREHLRLPRFKHDHPPVKNANVEHENALSPLDKLAIKITDKVGSMGFFLLIFT